MPPHIPPFGHVGGGVCQWTEIGIEPSPVWPWPSARWHSSASLALFFAVGKPFGAINEWTVGLAGLLGGLLALAIGSRHMAGASAAATVLTGATVVGAVIVVTGAALVTSQTTGFMLAGLVESLGYALIGLWLIAVNRSTGSALGWAGRLRNLGLVAGMVMAIGLVAAPGRDQSELETKTCQRNGQRSRFHACATTLGRI